MHKVFPFFNGLIRASSRLQRNNHPAEETIERAIKHNFVEEKNNDVSSRYAPFYLISNYIEMQFKNKKTEPLFVAITTSSHDHVIFLTSPL